MTDRTVLAIDPDKARALLAAGEAVLIDVREADEFARERIPGAHNVPLSRLDGAERLTAHAPVAIFHCRSGARTSQASRDLLATGFAEVRCLEGGLEAWKRAGHAVHVDRKAPLPLIRQVQIVAGSMVVLGAALAALVSPWFLLLAGGVGAGLVMAGLTGLCPLARALAAMPWNRSPATA